MSEDKNLKKLGKRIAQLRKSKGLTQIELAYKCDIERPNLARIEAGNTNPTFTTLCNISQALEITISELVAIE